MSESDLQALAAPDRLMLGGWACLEKVTVATCPALPAIGDGVLLAQVSARDGTISWASDTAADGQPDPQWGMHGETLVRGLGMEPPTTNAVPVSRLMPANQANSYRLQVTDQWNGSVQGFGERFWADVFAAYPDLAAPFERARSSVASVSYRDRYLNAPLPVALLLEVINGLKRRFADQWDLPRIAIETVELGAPRPVSTVRAVWADWTDETSRKGAVEEAFAYCGMANIHLSLTTKYDAEHARTLHIAFDDGTALVMQFDQGLSYWKANRSHSGGDAVRETGNGFDFSMSPSQQGEKIAELRTGLVNPNYPTFLYAHLR
jgi:hypothetical protein